MTWAARWRGLSVFGRTISLMIAALVPLGFIGNLVLSSVLPPPDGPVPLAEVIRRLRVPQERHVPPQPQSAAGTDREAPPELPPDPPMDGPLRGAGGPGPASHVSDRWSAVAPSPSGSFHLIDGIGAEVAEALRVAPSAVIAYAPAGSMERGGPRGEASFDGGFLVARRLPDGGWRVVERGMQSFPSVRQRALAEFVVASLLVLLPLSWLFARDLSAPLRRFSDAARRLGQDPNAPLLPREGPAEMLAAVDSFNAMQGRIKRLIHERTHMVGAIAHDLRTPLTRLAFRLDDLPQPLNSKVDADIQEMKSMISAALDFLRDRSLGQQHERLDLRLLVERVVNDQSDLGHDVTLERGAPLTVEGAPLALRRVAANLVDNALKYGMRARLRLRTSADRCILEVDDDGPGIPEPLQQQVFEPFFRIEGSRNRDTGGIGLGLATVHAVVLDHGGEVMLGNRKGGGLRVTVSLPAARG